MSVDDLGREVLALYTQLFGAFVALERRRAVDFLIARDNVRGLRLMLRTLQAERARREVMQ
jgi:hypothetical protein